MGSLLISGHLENKKATIITGSMKNHYCYNYIIEETHFIFKIT